MKELEHSFIIREARKSDAAALIEYVRIVSDQSDNLTFASDEWTMSVKDEEAHIEKHLNADNQLIIVAEDNGQIVGLLNVHASHKKRLKHIGEFGITVAQSHWGKGVGSAMMTHMLDWAKNNPIIRKINLKVNAVNKPAIRMYQKFGFKEEGLIRRDFFINGEFRDAYVMGLFIDH